MFVDCFWANEGHIPWWTIRAWPVSLLRKLSLLFLSLPLLLYLQKLALHLYFFPRVLIWHWSALSLYLWHISFICSGLLCICIFPRIIVFLLVYFVFIFVTHFLYFLSCPFLLLVTRTFRTLLILALFVFVLRMKTIYSIQKSSFMERTQGPHDEKCNRTDSERWNLKLNVFPRTWNLWVLL